MTVLHDTPLAQELRSRLLKGELLTLGDFMTIALGHPQHGYYIKQDPFGTDGDFTTAPEISQIFGEMIGLWMANFWQENLPTTEKIHLVECGPGRGTLLSDLLRAAKILPQFYECLSVHLVEMSPTLQQKQQQTLHPYLEEGLDISWHKSIDDLPEDAPLFIVGNEFFDALPIEQFVRTPKGWAKKALTLTPEGQLDFCPLLPATLHEKNAFPPASQQAVSGDILETCFVGQKLYRHLLKKLSKQKGCCLFFDYGYCDSALGDSFQALYKHQYVPVLDYVGDADLTAHVDFSSLLAAGRKENACQYGPLTMGHFLSNIGFAERAKALQAQASADQKQQIETASHRLLTPDQMGTLFKVIAATHLDATIPAGFAPIHKIS